jgi:hypothetical protein
VRWQRKQGRNSLHLVRELRQARQATEVRVRFAMRRALRTSRLEHGLCSTVVFAFDDTRLSLYLKLVVFVCSDASFFPWLKLSLERNGEGRNKEDWATLLNPFPPNSINMLRNTGFLHFSSVELTRTFSRNRQANSADILFCGVVVFLAPTCDRSKYFQNSMDMLSAPTQQF